jgi:hypothetical protein
LSLDSTYCLVRKAIFIGAGATVLMDVWIYALNRAFGLPMTNWALAGRWFWHLRTGKVFHDDIACAPPYENELAFGWLCHYAIGLIYAGIFILALPGWLSAPGLFPAWVFGMITILPGWFLMQPGTGAGWAASKRTNRLQIRCLNIISHSVFAVGLYAMGLLTR